MIFPPKMSNSKFPVLNFVFGRLYGGLHGSVSYMREVADTCIGIRSYRKVSVKEIRPILDLLFVLQNKFVTFSFEFIYILQ